jgi:hypothetical protein
MMMLEKSIRMNWEKSKNLKSSDSSPFIELAISRAFFLYFSIENAKTFSFTLTKWYNKMQIIIHGVISLNHFLKSSSHFIPFG